ncbi:hypothetical protein [Nocardioides sp. B-3]|uniref:hypothetical protein n=1 Tax=Nocardioides sp. B-3 TaxID=2895565 RepID=UPI003FA52CAE
MLLRALCRYLRQTGLGLGLEYIQGHTGPQRLARPRDRGTLRGPIRPGPRNAGG